MQWETKMGFLDEPNVFPWPYQPQPHVVHIQDCFLFWSFCTTAPNPLKTFFPCWQLPKLHFIFSWAESAFKLPHHQESRSRNSAKSQHLIDSPGFRILSPTSLALFFLVVKTDYLCIVLWCRFIYFYVKSFLILPVLFDSDVHSWLMAPSFFHTGGGPRSRPRSALWRNTAQERHLDKVQISPYILRSNDLSHIHPSLCKTSKTYLPNT